MVIRDRALFDGTAQFVSPGFGTEDSQAQRQLVRVQALALDLVGDVEHVGGGDHDDVRLEIFDQLHLLLGLAAGHGNHRAAQAFGAVVRPQAAGEQAVAVGNMHLVPGPAAGGRPGDKVHISYGYGLFTGGLGAHYGAERLGCTVIPMSGGQTEKQVQLIKDFQPDIIMVTPSYMLNIADEIERQGLDPHQLALRLGIFGAEPWTDELRSAIEQRPVSYNHLTLPTKRIV